MKVGYKIYFADTSVAFIFWMPIGVLNDFWSGLTPWQVLKARMVAALIILGYGRLFGLYHDFLAPVLIRFWSEKVVNTFLFVSFDLIVWGGIALLAGADFRQFFRGFASLAVFLVLIGDWYVKRMKKARRWLSGSKNSP